MQNSKEKHNNQQLTSLRHNTTKRFQTCAIECSATEAGPEKVLLVSMSTNYLEYISPLLQQKRMKQTRIWQQGYGLIMLRRRVVLFLETGEVALGCAAYIDVCESGELKD
uniref:Uncharacterized protein n=1 Tax=Timema bartmani TaxID=61472 RepID=A0A7R9I4K6_9NEOP|nr:unnamed protein product [Timema bartmani]